MIGQSGRCATDRAEVAGPVHGEDMFSSDCPMAITSFFSCCSHTTFKDMLMTMCRYGMLSPGVEEVCCMYSKLQIQTFFCSCVLDNRVGVQAGRLVQNAPAAATLGENGWH